MSTDLTWGLTPPARPKKHATQSEPTAETNEAAAAAEIAAAEAEVASAARPSREVPQDFYGRPVRHDGTDRYEVVWTAPERDELAAGPIVPFREHLLRGTSVTMPIGGDDVAELHAL